LTEESSPFLFDLSVLQALINITNTNTENLIMLFLIV